MIGTVSLNIQWLQTFHVALCAITMLAYKHDVDKSGWRRDHGGICLFCLITPAFACAVSWSTSMGSEDGLMWARVCAVTLCDVVTAYGMVVVVVEWSGK